MAASRTRDHARAQRDVVIVAALAALLIAGRSIAVSVQTPPSSITIALAGQSMLRSDLRSTAPAEIPVIQSLLKGDVIFTNLEAAIALPGETTQQGRGFLTPPEALEALTAMGFNLLALSGNHAFDLGETGIRNTLREAERRQIAHAGTGLSLDDASAPAYLRTPKGTIALVASASGLIAAGAAASASHPGVNELRIEAGGRPNEATEDFPGAPSNAPHAADAERILRSIRDARQHADLVVVYQHNHVFGSHSFSTIFTEGMAERLAPNPWLQKWTHDEIDAGADIVVMHGAPLLHGIEVYRGRPIFYDLGNFIYNVPPTLTYIDEPMAWESAVASVEFAPAIAGGRTSLQAITLRPVVLNNIGEGQPDVHDAYASNMFLHTRGLPSPATGARAGYILQRIGDASTPFGTTLTISAAEAKVVVKR